MNSSPVLAAAAPRKEEFRNDFVRTFVAEAKRLETNDGSFDAPDLAYALVLDAQRERASDIHIEPHSDGYRLRLRIDGVLHDAAMVRTRHARILLNQFKAISDLDPI